jgi:transcriptional regulator with XRE-family HTH domain
MGGKARTPSENAVDNIKRWMTSRGIGQQELANRLTKFEEDAAASPGSTRTWQRRSINRLLNHQRRIDIDELYAIALVLGANVGMLLFPEPQDKSDSDRFQIGGMPSIGEWEMTALLARPTEVMSRPRIGVEGWDSDGPLTWVRKPSATAEAVERLRRAYEEAHPRVDIDEVNSGDVLRWAEEQGADVPD